MNRVKIKGLMEIPDRLEEINLPLNADVTGTEELSDYAETFYAACEAYEKAMSDGVLDISDAIHLGNVAISLFRALEGSSQAWREAAELSDDEIEGLVDLSRQYKLGNGSPRYRQILKTLLTAIQTVTFFMTGI